MMYLLEKIKDGTSYRKGERIWSDFRCPGWRVIATKDKNGCIRYKR